MADSDKMSRREERRKNKKKQKQKQKQDPNQKAKSWAREWFDALLWALLAALIIRALIFAPYRIPTPSMEETLLTGDFLLVSKFHYGARTPQSLGIPIIGPHVPNLRLPSTRLPGFSDIKRNDIVVFNYPIDDGIPSQKTNYIKRAVGMPGDTLQIENKILYVNHEPAEEFDTFHRLYYVTPLEGVRVSQDRIRSAGAVPLHQRGLTRPGEPQPFFMTEETAAEVESWGDVESVQMHMRPENEHTNRNSNFRFARGLSDGNPDHMPEIVIPFSGQEITVTTDNLNLYYDLIGKYEGNQLEVRNNRVFINGRETDSYVVQQDYYFMMGDNRDNSEDSRAWGFVPEDHVVGRAWVIYFSIDGWVPRGSRILRTLH